MSEQYHDTFPTNNSWVKMPIGLTPRLALLFLDQRKPDVTALSVLIFLCEMTQRHNAYKKLSDEGLCLSAQDIATKLGRKRDAIAKALKRLEKNGWITLTTSPPSKSFIAVNVGKILKETDRDLIDLPDYDEHRQLQQWDRFLQKAKK